ncbi:MAG: Ig-like domain-containing protein [Candidatus Sulfotelmatobacter sp.]
MSSTKNKLRLTGVFSALATLVLAVSCTGFFVNPTITSVTIEPSSPSVSVDSTEQLNAVGTDSEGNTYTLTGGTSCTGTTVCWSSSDTSTVTITSGGLLKGIATGSATITASSGSATATASAAVTLSDVTAITLMPTSVSLTENTTASGSQCITASAAVSGGGTQDISATVTWNTNNTTLITVENGEDPMCFLTGSSTGNATIFATYDSNGTTITSNSVSVMVTQ